MKINLTPAQIALISNALMLAAEEYERHQYVTSDIEGAEVIAEHFRWQAETARELSGEMMIATKVTIAS